MTLVMRAIKYMVRNFIKSLLIVSIFTVVTSFILISLTLRMAIGTTVEFVHFNNPAIVSVGPDFNRLFEAGLGEFDAIMTQEDVEAIGNLNYVLNFDFSITIGVRADIDEVNPQTNLNTQQIPRTDLGFFSLIGVHDMEMYFENGLMELLEGRMFNEGDITGGVSVPVLVNFELAQKNGLQLGSTISVYQQLFRLPEGAEVPLEGIFIEDMYEL